MKHHAALYKGNLKEKKCFLYIGEERKKTSGLFDRKTPDCFCLKA